MGKTTTIGGIEIERFLHSAVRVESEDTRVYVDVFDDALTGDEPSADVILSSHSHWDHFDPDSVNRLATDDTAVIIHEASDTSDIGVGAVVAVGADEFLTMNGVSVETVSAHNLVRMRNPGEPFHPPREGVGYVFDIDGMSFYHLGDTCPLDHMAEIDADVMFVPIGGNFVQSVGDAYWSLHMVQPDVAIPIHYGYVDASKPDPSGFKEMISELNEDASLDIEARVL
jgi:L-ascorbate metabolism protein UlaG (beta-lactamase superfamily)